MTGAMCRGAWSEAVYFVHVYVFETLIYGRSHARATVNYQDTHNFCGIIRFNSLFVIYL